MNSGILNTGRNATPKERAILAYELGLKPSEATKQELIIALQSHVENSDVDDLGLSPAVAGFRYDAWRGLLKF